MEDFEIKVEEINRCWTEMFAPQAKSWAAYASALEVDLLLVSGKPSEQPSIRDLIHRMVPLPKPRVIFAKNFEAGDWWPMGDKQVADAKHVTAVGLALYSAIQRGEERGWAIQANPGDPASWWNHNHWGTISEKMDRLKAKDIFLHPQDGEASVLMQLGSRIARQLLKEGGHADFVYELRWRDKDKRIHGEGTADQDARPTLTVALKRESHVSGERLVLVKATTQDGRDVTKQVELHLNTMVAKTHWRDSGRFSLTEQPSQQSRGGPK